jgi:hypothetical protein
MKKMTLHRLSFSLCQTDLHAGGDTADGLFCEIYVCLMIRQGHTWVETGSDVYNRKMETAVSKQAVSPIGPS